MQLTTWHQNGNVVHFDAIMVQEMEAQAHLDASLKIEAPFW
jgi:hypothetical protein